MNRIIAVIGNTFRESIRDKVFYVLLFFAVTTILGSKVLGWVSIGQDVKIIKDICLAAMSIFGTLIAIFVGANLVYKEIDKKTLYTLLAQPMHRYEFLLGKCLGLLAVITVSMLFMTAGATLYLWLMGGMVTVVWFQAILLIFLKLMLITAFSVLLSTMISPILGAIVVVSFYFAGHATEIFRDLPSQFEGTFIKGLLQILYFAIPNLNVFNLQSEAANNVPVAAPYMGFAAAYGLAWTALLLILACMAFERRDV
ncbi:MAG TPA: ABC transporter permease subunit [Candidatus Hydrogenedentes bacterium]|jgi:ABC-type transport system involved in multi-copper enzyme maturation permease subunit|nr:MAG: ABC-2 family transporter protein [Candidatus Hydrogenedentes bacterium ADurb.Bin179]HOC70510.1 ABC transporter permease subunit [Candidatus Hydrogenedentota bacterium]